MGVLPKDYDYCVTGLNSEEFKNIFPEAFIRGKDFSVFDIEGTEFALARKERKISPGHIGFMIETNKSFSIEDDLKRRDITINSMAIEVLTNKLIDPFGGQKDLEEKTIRATSIAFIEDPLRAYRVARFAAELNFKVATETIKLIEYLKEELLTLSVERVFVEFKKALLSKHPSTFFLVLKDANCLKFHFEEIFNMIGIEQPLNHHPEGDVFNHTMDVITRASQQTNDELILFAALVHDFGKINTPKEILPHHYNHENNGDELVKKFCNRLKMPTNYRKVGITSCHEHMKAGKYSDLRASTKVDFLVKNQKTLLGLEGLEIIANADKQRENEIKFAKLGNTMIKEISGKTIDCINNDFNKLNDKIRQKRIEWLKKNSCNF